MESVNQRQSERESGRDYQGLQTGLYLKSTMELCRAKMGVHPKGTTCPSSGSTEPLRWRQGGPDDLCSVWDDKILLGLPWHMIRIVPTICLSGMGAYGPDVKKEVPCGRRQPTKGCLF